jgi:hypothetical protein
MVMVRIFADVRFRKGLESDGIPVFPEGQPAITSDTKRVFVGSADGNVELAKKESIDLLGGRLDGVDSSLADIAYSVKSKGAKCDGVTDDWDAFVDASNYCVANGLTLFIPGTMKIVKKQDITIPAMYGILASKISVSGNYSFLLSNGFKIKNLQIEETSNKGVFKANSLVDDITFDDVKMTSIVSNMDGSVHGGSSIALNGGVTNLTINKCVSNNFATMLYIDKASSDISIDNVKITNFVTGIYLHGYEPKLTGGTWVDKVDITNIRLFNTSTQQSTIRSQGSVAGKDGILMAYVSNLRMDDVVCEYPAERVYYCSYGKNHKLNNFRLYNAGTIKFVGDNRKNVGAVYGTPANNNISDGCWISDVVSETTLADEACIEFYNARNIYVDDVHFDGNGVGDVFVFTKELVENLNIRDCTSKNTKRSFWTYYDRLEGVIAINDGINQIDAKTPSDYDAWVKGAKFINNTMENIGAYGYCAFRADDTTTPSVGTYKFQNFVIEGNKAHIVDSDGYDDSLNGSVGFKGLIEINHLSDWRIENNKVHGFRMKDGSNNIISLLPFIIGSNSNAIVLRHKHTHRGQETANYLFGTLYLSMGSEIELIGGTRVSGTSSKKIFTVKAPNGTGVTATTFDMNVNFILDITASINLSTLLFASLFGDTTASSAFPFPSNLYGYINIQDASGNVGLFQMKTDGTMVLKTGSDSTVFSATNDFAKISVYKTGTAILIRGVQSPSVVPSNLMIKARLQPAV